MTTTTTCPAAMMDSRYSATQSGLPRVRAACAASARPSTRLPDGGLCLARFAPISEQERADLVRLLSRGALRGIAHGPVRLDCR